MGLGNILLVPGAGRMTFAQALRLLQPYSPRLAYNFIEPANSLFQGNTLTPVTTVTNPVGVVIDQSQGGLGNLGAEILPNGGFAGTTGWAVRGSWAISGGVATASTTSTSLISTTAVTAARFYLVQFDITSYTSGTLFVRIGGGAASTFNSIGTKTCILSSSNTAGVEFYGGSIAATIDNISVRELPGNHATASSDAKRPLFNSYSLGGKSRFGIQFDGVDDCLQVANFDLSDTDKVTVIAFTRKLTNVSFQCHVEHSSDAGTNNGSFNMFGPAASSGARDYGFRSTGTISVPAESPTTFPAPLSAMVVGVGDISGDVSRLMVNNTQVAISTSNQGTGNYGNYTLNIGQRAGLSFALNGYMHVLFACGTIVPDSVLTRIYRGLGPIIGVTV